MITLVLAAVVTSVVWFFVTGHRAYVVHTGSMSPTYKPGSLVIDGPARGSYRPGEVITFRHSPYTTDVVTHRITDVTAAGLIHTKGDGNGTPDVWDIRPSQVRGAVIAGVPLAGYVIVYLQQPAGVGSVIAAVLSLILLWSLCFPAADERPVRVGRLRAWRAKRGGPKPAADVFMAASVQ
jgi:signal peptidase